MQISFVVPNRNNLKYFKWSYDSIRKNQGNHEVWICSAIDACSDGTLEWYEELEKKDPYFKFIVNKGPERLGHTVLYNKIVEELVETELAMIWHCDMYLCPRALDEIKQLMFDNTEFKFDSYGSGSYADYDYNGKLIKESVTNAGNGRIYSDPFPVKKRIVSLTRIEPPLHPAGYEKIIANFGTEPENFDEIGLLTQLYVWKNLSEWKQTDNDGNEFHVPLKGTTDGVFAPWTFWVDEFLEIGGHDYLYRPQSKEDDDIWNRFLLNGTKFIQTREGYCYHMTCRGSRFNPFLTTPGKNSEEWEIHNQKSTRNYIRKWGKFISHTKYGLPIVSHKYNITFVINNCSENLLFHLEPWCDALANDLSYENNLKYVEVEQKNTKFNLKKKILNLTAPQKSVEIVVEIDGNRFEQYDFTNIQHLSGIITESGEIGQFELGNLKITINTMNHYENDLIVCKNEPILLED